MTLLDKIKEKQLVARKAYLNDSAELYTTLLGEAQMVGKTAGNRDSTDSEVLAVIGKFIKNINETLSYLDVASPKATKLARQAELLNEFMPIKLTSQDIADKVAYLREEVGLTAMKDIMAYFKKNCPCAYDGKELAKLLGK